MFEPDDHEERERRANSAGERVGLLAFIGFVAFAFWMELSTGASPARWAIPLMAAFWVPLLIVHEAGHVLMARALGWRVERVVIGFGAPWRELVISGVPIEVRTLPVEGFVQTRPEDGIARPLPHAAIYLAGPGIELLLAALLVLAFGPEEFLRVGGDFSLLVWQSLALTAVLGAVVNLIPHSTLQGDREVPNDGLGILLALSGGTRRF